MSLILCTECKAVIPLSDGAEAIYRSSHETFYCIHGHAQYFPKGKTELQKMQEDRDAWKRSSDSYYKWYKESQASKEVLYRRISALRGVITKMKKARGR